MLVPVAGVYAYVCVVTGYKDVLCGLQFLSRTSQEWWSEGVRGDVGQLLSVLFIILLYLTNAYGAVWPIGSRC